MLSRGANPQLINAGAHTRHCLPVVWFQPLLNQVQLVTGETSRVIREGSQVLEAGACPEERFHGQDDYTASCMTARKQGRSATPPATTFSLPAPRPAGHGSPTSPGADSGRPAILMLS